MSSVQLWPEMQAALQEAAAERERESERESERDSESENEGESEGEGKRLVSSCDVSSGALRSLPALRRTATSRRCRSSSSSEDCPETCHPVPFSLWL